MKTYIIKTAVFFIFLFNSFFSFCFEKKTIVESPDKQLYKKILENSSEPNLYSSKENVLQYVEFLIKNNSSTLKSGSNLAEILCRPELSYEILSELDPDREPLPRDVIEQVDIEIKYEGYMARQLRQIEQFKKMENKKIPENIDYNEVPSLRIEARQKLSMYKPVNVGQASRISGVSPADISVLLVYLEHFRNRN